MLLSSLAAVGCADAGDALEDGDPPALAQAMDAGRAVSRGDGSVDGGVVTRPAGDGGTATSPGSDAGSSGGGDGVDITGTWYAEVTSKADITAPLVGTAPSEVSLALKLLVTADGDELKIDATVCNLDVKGDSLALNFDKVEPFIETSASVPSFAAAIGENVPLPDLVFRIGQDESGASVDIDSDGKDGATIASTALGAVPFDAYVGMDLKIEMDAILKDAKTVSGSATYSTTGKLFGSGIPLVTSGAVSVKQTQIPTTFEAEHHDGDVSCADLM